MIIWNCRNYLCADAWLLLHFPAIAKISNLLQLCNISGGGGLALCVSTMITHNFLGFRLEIVSISLRFGQLLWVRIRYIMHNAFALTPVCSFLACGIYSVL